MERLNFTLPEWTRVIWTSAIAKGTWEPRIGRIIRAWSKVERAARDSIQVVSPDNLPQLVYEMSEMGKIVVPVDKIGRVTLYASSHVAVEPGQPWDFKVVTTTPARIEEWIKAYKDGDNFKMGDLLGYPPCCVSFFQKVWIDEHYLDTTWPMVHSLSGAKDRLVSIKVIPQCNVLLRWVGVRLVPHLPCSFDCPATIETAKVFAETFREMGLSEEYNWCIEMLSWPTEWSALHGIAEIKNPLFKISARTDATGLEYRVQVTSDSYPREGAVGLKFPFLKEGQIIDRRGPVSPTEYKDNGFSSIEYQEIAHSIVIDAAVYAIGKAGRKSVFDLGCGNGRLLERIRERTNCLAVGVDEAEGKIGRGQYLHPKLTLYFGDIFDPMIWRLQTGVSLLSGNRLWEVDPERGKQLARRIMEESEFVVLYAYDGDVDLDLAEAFFAPWTSKLRLNDNGTKVVVLSV